ncbi:MAG: iron-containing alcohol dehydrogenase, partial [Stellaceae bacterium]
MAAIITTPRLLAIGGGALAELPGMLTRFGLTRPLIVTDPYIPDCGILERAAALLDRARIGSELFADTVPDPTTAV